MRHNKHRGSRRRRSRNIINNTLNKSVSFVKSTSNKYMPKIKTGLENVGSKVNTNASRTIPFFQKMTRKLFGTFSSKSRKYKKH